MDKYNVDGTMKEIQNANGMKTTYAYDIDKNIQELNIQLNGETIAKNQYAYDESGNRTEKQQLRGTTTYTYDNLNRLTKAQYPDYGEELYYDKTGNRTKRIANGIEEYYNYDERNRLTSHIKQGKETQYHYDNAGNLLDDGERKYEYDGFNRNTRVETKDGQVQINRYDAEGLRYEIEENNKLVQFIYNENKEVIVEKTDENLKRLIRSFDLWASECTQEKTWYHYASDEQGSIIFIADEKEIKNRYEYDAFGNAVICEEQVENRYKYTGQQYDQITQQYYLRARYYNPVIARFTQEDAYRGDGLNLYAYCDNNPVMYYDPSGYASDCLKDAYKKQHEEQRNRGIENYDSPEAKKEAYEKSKDIVDFNKKVDSGQIYEESPGRWKDRNTGKYVKNPNRPDNPKPSVPDDNPSSSGGGRWGTDATREQNRQIAQELEARGYRVIGIGGRKGLQEEYLPGNTPGSTKGSNYVDITLEAPDGRIIRINTVTTDASGKITKLEQSAADAINAKRPNDPPIITIPKGSGLGNLSEELEKRGFPGL